MSEFRDGEIVDITIRGARVANMYGTHRGLQGGPYEDTGTVLVFRLDASPSNERSLVLNLATPGVTVERVAPAEWPPRPGDIWAGPTNERWFAVKYYGDFDDPQDFKGCNRHGWRVVLMPMQIGPYGDSEKEPDDALRTRGPLTLVHREEEQADGEVSEP